VDKPTLKSIQQGDKTAFAALVGRFQKPLFSYLGKMTLPQAIAEEIAQETFIRAWQAKETFDSDKASISTWLFTIARRLALNELDRASHRFEVSDQASATSSDDPTVEEFEGNQFLNPQKTLQRSELKQALWLALKTLSPHDRSLLALAYLKDLEFAAIAEIEGIPVGTVKSRLHRIRQQLKSTLSGESIHEQ
jgi:RNA polymerase sigma-70 factor (ECF subfamily)